MLNKFHIAETDHFKKKIILPEYKRYYDKTANYVYPQLQNNPYFGPNIKKLKGEFENVYRYRMGDVRLFYVIDEKRVIVIITDIENRKDSYK